MERSAATPRVSNHEAIGYASTIRAIVKNLYRAGIKVGPTDRIGLFSEGGPGAGAALLAGASGAGAASGAAAVVPFLAAVGAGLAGTRDIFFALSSVTMMSPCCSAAALSSMLFRASDHVCPTALHEQDGLNSWR